MPLLAPALFLLAVAAIQARAPQRVARLAQARPASFKGGGDVQNGSNWKTGVNIHQALVHAGNCCCGAGGSSRGLWVLAAVQLWEDNMASQMAYLTTSSSVCFGNMCDNRPDTAL